VIVLAIDTCDSRGSVAVLRGNAVVDLRVHETPDDYSSWLIPAAEAVLREAGLKLADVEGFSAAAGPGSFTGVRVGLTTVKAWVEVLKKPVAAVSRLEAIAMESGSPEKFVAAFADARREQVFGALFRREGEGFRLVGEEMVIAPGDFVRSVESAVAGERTGWASTDPQIVTGQPEWKEREALGESIVAVKAVLAPAIGRIGARKIAAGETTDALRLDANYVRRSDAEIFWKGAAHGR
jgi:tRNA threonylcarbamoyladenosine biosynthesis protein TsaB